MNAKNITVVTICYNIEKEIEFTIKSVLSQTYTNYEFIIVDGASKDGTMTVVNKYKDKIDVIISERDHGIYDAMNKGIRFAHGEWIIMMNGGDAFADEHVLENVFAKPIEDNISFLYSDTYSQKPDGSIVRGKCDFASGRILHQAVIYRRKLHEEHGLYIVTKKLIISDYLFFIRIPEKEVKKIDTIICYSAAGGASQQGGWSGRNAILADVVFNRRSLSNALFSIVKKSIQNSIPYSIRAFVKRLLGRENRVS